MSHESHCPDDPNLSEARSTAQTQSRVSEFWAEALTLEEKRLVAWMEHPYVLSHINRRTTGNERTDWCRYVRQKWFGSPVQTALNLGCGDGGFEGLLYELGFAERIEAIDISKGAIEKARARVASAGLQDKIEHSVADLNELRLKEGIYGAIFCCMSIHHVRNLENLFEQAAKGLQPGGMLIFNEYVGPNRFQMPDERVRMINAALQLLPPRFRRLIVKGAATDKVKEVHRNTLLSWFEVNDPSESERSADILEVARKYFDYLEFKPYGGGIAHLALKDIAGNFVTDEDTKWLDVLLKLEGDLEERGLLESDFVMAVATPRQ
jgi:SAM-dependent methyltransferase